jgi:hypothetical protein
MAAITLPYDIAMYTGSSYAAIVGTTAITNPYAVVKWGTNQGEVIIGAANTDACCGVICEQGVSASNTLAVGDRVTVYTSGHVLAMASAALSTIGALVSAAAAGKIGALGASNYVGRLYGTAAGDTELVPMLIELGAIA